MAYNTFLYVDTKNGSDANSGLTEALAYLTFYKAFDTVQVAVTDDIYTIFILGGEELPEFSTANLGQYTCRIVFKYGAKIKGAGTGVGLRTLSPNFKAGVTEIYGANVENCQYAFAGGALGGGTAGPQVSFFDCKFDGAMFLERGLSLKFYRTAFNNVAFDYSTNGNSSVLLPKILENCSFNNCDNIFIGENSNGGSDSIDRYLKIKDSSIIFYTADAVIFSSIVFDNCEVKFVNNTTGATWAAIQSIAYASVTNATELNAKRNLDLSLSESNWGDRIINFDTIDFIDVSEGNLFPPNKNLYQYNSDNNKRHIGANRYAIYIDSTQMTPPANGSVVSGYAVSTAAPSTGIEFICDAIEFDSAKIIKRISVIADIGVGGEILSSQTENVNQRIIDVDMCFSATKTAAELDASPESYSTYEIGIVDTALNYDNVNQVAKSCKLKFTLKNEGVSTDFGEVKVYQVIVETEDVMSFENYTDFELKQYGNFHLRVEYDTNLWIGANDINLNPKGESTTQAVLDTYSGTPGKTIFTDQELYALVAAAGGDIILTYAETLDAVLAVDIIADGNQNTNLAQITTTAGIPIWSYDMI